MSIYRSHDGREAIETWYELAVDRLEVNPTERTVETRYGSTHVLLVGPVDGPPVFVFHGGNATNPMTLAWYIGLADEYRLIAPDTVGHPGMSAQTRLDPASDEYGRWVADVMDALDVRSAPMIGTSYGAGIVLLTAAFDPDRIDRAALVVPSGFGVGPLHSLLWIGLPSVLYRFVPRDWLLDRIVSSLVTDAEGDDLARGTIGASLRHVKLERKMPDVPAEDLEGFNAPVALFFGEEDPFFPPETIVPRARERLGPPAHVGVLRGEKHVLSRAGRATVTERIREFLEAR